MLLNDILIASVYLVLIALFIGTGWKVLPKEMKDMIKKIVVKIWKELFKKKEVKNGKQTNK